VFFIVSALFLPQRQSTRFDRPLCLQIKFICTESAHRLPHTVDEFKSLTIFCILHISGKRQIRWIMGNERCKIPIHHTYQVDTVIIPIYQFRRKKTNRHCTNKQYYGKSHDCIVPQVIKGRSYIKMLFISIYRLLF